MTQLAQAGRRTTVATSAIVAAAVSAAITISALLIVPALTAVPFDGLDTTGLDRAVEAGRAWQHQRLIESPAYYEGLHAAEQAGLEWQLRYEQTNPNR